MFGFLQDARTDQYALAVTAYELFSGHVPFQGSDIGVLRECVLNVEPEPIRGLPEHVNAALFKGLAKKREDRFENCKAFVKAMATKPKEAATTDDVSSENDLSQQGGEISLPSDRAVGVTTPPVWKPQTMTNSQADAMIRESQKVLKKGKSQPKWLLPIAGIILLLLAIPISLLILSMMPF